MDEIYNGAPDPRITLNCYSSIPMLLFLISTLIKNLKKTKKI